MFSFFTGGPNYDDGAQMYVNASNKFKMAKNNKLCSEALLRAAFAYNKAQDRNQEARCYGDAADCMAKYDVDGSCEYYDKCVSIYNDSGRFGQGGKVYKKLAEVYESENQYKLASQYYSKAADLFDMDEFGKSSYSQCILKYAEISSKYDDNVEEAVQIFEKEGEKALRNTLIQYGAKEYFLKAGILLISMGDLVTAKAKCERYDQLDPRLGSSREGRLLNEMLEAFGDKDADKFAAAIQEYDSITRLDSWKIHFLYKAKEIIKPSGLTADGTVDLS